MEVDSPLLLLAVRRFGRLTMEDDDETFDVVVTAVVRGMLSIDDCEDAKNNKQLNYSPFIKKFNVIVVAHFFVVLDGSVLMSPQSYVILEHLLISLLSLEAVVCPLQLFPNKCYFGYQAMISDASPRYQHDTSLCTSDRTRKKT